MRMEATTNQDFFIMGCSFPGNVALTPGWFTKDSAHSRLLDGSTSSECMEYVTRAVRRLKSGRENYENVPNLDLHTYSFLLYIYASAAAHFRPRFRFVGERIAAMKDLRHSAIRELV